MTVRFGRVDEQRALCRLPIDAASPAEARRFTLALLSTWGLGDLADVAELLVSELVTNAVRYGRTSCTLELSATPTALRGLVTDDGDGDPEVRHAASNDLHGRGLAIVEALAARWGVERIESGKIVWFELPTDSVARTT